jgi:succinate dehydrogenase / fumarate reductase, flavoprotein subunit
MSTRWSPSTTPNRSVDERRIATGVLVIGSGAAGLRAAIELAERGVDVLCVAKRRRDDARTVRAAGGVNAALGTMDPEDSWQQHAADTLSEGYWLGDPASVELLCSGAPAAIDELVRWGTRLGREPDGRLSQRFFGAHRYRRTCFAGDYTGREIQQALVRRAAELGVTVREDIYVTRLLVHYCRIFGAYGFDLEDGGRWLIIADAVVLAAGSHTRIWRRSSSRQDEDTGDAMRLAAEAGCRLRDMEFVQFHPTGMVHPEEWAGTLVTEAVRAEGGILRNAEGERFMERYDPERLELSTRDRVALANYTEIATPLQTEPWANGSSRPWTRTRSSSSPSSGLRRERAESRARPQARTGARSHSGQPSNALTQKYTPGPAVAPSVLRAV